ncbi:hypothetical protein [Nissabacter sp. SGAir0207]|uniref:hypothetical protein n=1 Tax=Nissabacter sp. SGAir0207 TaxID=2126321 RepID=UPI0010CCF93A|nr:hypothetical protein [Nissabacter sp. SGAir0207]QCR36688.1 hypothetical protein C1N62_11580 [Nissabacter sp. SGAir0207]
MQQAQKAVTGTLLAIGLLAAQASAAERCPMKNQQINESNALILLGGTGRGEIRDFSAGTIGKDVNLQSHYSGSFDRCGQLEEAAFKYQKTERNVRLEMANHTLRSGEGWVTQYDIAVSMFRDNQVRLLTRKRGTLHFTTGKHGNITAATDTFLINEERGFTNSTYRYDDQWRLVESTARGTDALNNEQLRYRYSPQGWLLASDSDKGGISYRYDDKGVEQSSTRHNRSAVSESSSLESCQSWDEHGNCTLSETLETEMFATMRLTRNISTAYQYHYWDDAPTADQ